jgi:hypothetical protein
MLANKELSAVLAGMVSGSGLTVISLALVQRLVDPSCRFLELPADAFTILAGAATTVAAIYAINGLATWRKQSHFELIKDARIKLGKLEFEFSNLFDASGRHRSSKKLIRAELKQANEFAMQLEAEYKSNLEKYDQALSNLKAACSMIDSIVLGGKSTLTPETSALTVPRTHLELSCRIGDMEAASKFQIDAWEEFHHHAKILHAQISETEQTLR